MSTHDKNVTEQYLSLALASPSTFHSILFHFLQANLHPLVSHTKEVQTHSLQKPSMGHPFTYFSNPVSQYREIWNRGQA